MGDPWIGDLAALSVDGNLITAGSSLAVAANQKVITAPACWSRGEVDIPGATKYIITVNCTDEDDHADFLVLLAISRAKLAVPILAYPRGNVAGRLIYSGNAYVSEPSLDVSLDKAATYVFTLSFTDDLTITPNIVLAATAATAGQANAAYAGFTFAASGGTAPYTYDLPTFAGTAFPIEGLTFTNGVLAGTPNANAPVGTHYFYMTVTDNAATPVVKTFLCSIVIAAA